MGINANLANVKKHVVSRMAGVFALVCTLMKSSLGQVASEQLTLSGQDMVTKMGSFMSGHPNCGNIHARSGESFNPIFPKSFTNFLDKTGMTEK